MATMFRLCGPRDAATLELDLAQWHRDEGQRFDPAGARAGVTRFLNDSQLGHVWLIEQAGRPIGYVVLTFSHPVQSSPPRAYVSGLYLVPGHRGRGIGRLALRLMEDVGRSLWVRVTHFGAEGENKHAQVLFRRPAPAGSAAGILQSEQAVA